MKQLIPEETAPFTRKELRELMRQGLYMGLAVGSLITAAFAVLFARAGGCL